MGSKSARHWGPKKKGARSSLEAGFQPALGFIHVLDVGFEDQQIRLAVSVHFEAAFTRGPVLADVTYDLTVTPT